MKRITSIFLIVTVIMSVFVVSSISTSAASNPETVSVTKTSMGKNGDVYVQWRTLPYCRYYRVFYKIDNAGWTKAADVYYTSQGNYYPGQTMSKQITVPLNKIHFGDANDTVRIYVTVRGMDANKTYNTSYRSYLVSSDTLKTFAPRMCLANIDNGKATFGILIFREVNGMSSEGYEIIPMKPEEVLYSYRNSQQISSQTGLVGYIRADMGTNGNQFWVTWNCFRNDLNTPEFSNELSELLLSLRQDGKYLSDRDTLMRFCLDSKNALPYETGRDFGVRVNTRDHAYLMRLNPHKGEYNLYCYCYRKDWLDSHIRQAKRGIRFIDPHYRERFRIADGDEIIISGEPNAYTVRDVPARYVCRYIDDSHFEYGPNLRHICEFAEMIEDLGYKVIPLTVYV